jgi:hypothetical protein
MLYGSANGAWKELVTRDMPVAKSFPEQIWGAFTARPVLWIVAVVETIAAPLLILLAGYLALFKMHLRKIHPFSKYTWKQELPRRGGNHRVRHRLHDAAQPIHEIAARQEGHRLPAARHRG